MRVARNSWSNALACCVGSAVGRAGTLFQCSSEEAEELEIGMAGFTSYAETVSVYGTESAFIDGDDTPGPKRGWRRHMPHAGSRCAALRARRPNC